MTEGYWRKEKDEESPLPFPQPTEEKWDRENFMEKLAKLETTAHRRTYRGLSVCRICGCWNGNSEYTLQDWTWPQGLSHYIREHNVKPTDAFIAFVGSNDSARHG